MSITLAHPFRLTASGSLATIAEGSAAHAAQLAGHTLSTTVGERPLAPGFGLPDLAGGSVDAGQVAGALAACTPELAVDAITVTQTPDGHVDITVAVDWTQEDL